MVFLKQNKSHVYFVFYLYSCILKLFYKTVTFVKNTVFYGYLKEQNTKNLSEIVAIARVDSGFSIRKWDLSFIFWRNGNFA